VIGWIKTGIKAVPNVDKYQQMRLLLIDPV